MEPDSCLSLIAGLNGGFSYLEDTGTGSIFKKSVAEAKSLKLTGIIIF